jgi:hypothetical protein
MGMGYAACNAYVLPATLEYFNKLNIHFDEDDVKEVYTKEEWDHINNNGLSDEEYWDEIEQVIQYYADEQKDIEASINDTVFYITIFRYSDESGDRYDDLEDGYYFVFDEEVLYERKYTDIGKTLSDANLFPVHANWVNFG